MSAYEEAGVDYKTLDAAKKTALLAARATASFARRRGALVDETSFGEPAVVFSVGDLVLGFVLECLGTKSVIARNYEEETGVDRFAAIGYDTVAAAVNDCICVGALPLVVTMYFATGSAEFYEGTRAQSLVDGVARACRDAGASWGGGESPTLSGLVHPKAVDLAASVVGAVPKGVIPLAGSRIAAGDEIVLFSSSGLHANGASLARAVAASLPMGLSTELASGRQLGEALLDESVIYVGLLDALFRRHLDLHYASHITGHGWRKLMRADKDLTYRIEALPEVPEVLSFLVERSGLSPREAYGTFNMGAGFACFVEEGSAEEVVKTAEELGYVALRAGRVEEGERRVVLEPLDVVYSSEELDLR